MIESPELVAALETSISDAAGPFRLERATPAAGGCIHRSYVLEGGGRKFFSKINERSQSDSFAAEADGLAALAAAGVRVPAPLGRGETRKDAFLVLEYLELHGLSVQLTEALAEYWHARIRRELGIADADPEDLDGFFKVGYRGARYSFGYPACPDLADRAKVVRLLEPSRIGVELSEEMQLHPEQSTDAIVVHHPEAKYFSV